MSFFFFPSVALDSIIHPLVKTGRTKCDLCGTAFAVFWRRGRDSNPCGVAPKRFSRPPRYDHFDTSPYRCYDIIAQLFIFVNRFLKIPAGCFLTRIICGCIISNGDKKGNYLLLIGRK